MRLRLYNRKTKRNKSTYTYEQKSINDLLYNIKLDVVIGDYISLKKTKSAFYGRCPICKPKTLNQKHFRINTKLNIFKCYECGVSGKTIAGFIMRYYNIPYDESLKFIESNKKWNNKNKKLIFKDNVVNKIVSIENENLPF